MRSNVVDWCINGWRLGVRPCDSDCPVDAAARGVHFCVLPLGATVAVVSNEVGAALDPPDHHHPVGMFKFVGGRWRLLAA